MLKRIDPIVELKTLIAAAAATAMGLCAATPAQAAQHLVSIQEVFVGTPSDSANPDLTPDQRAQYVMLRMTSFGQSFTTNLALRVEDATGNILGKFGTVTASVANGGSAGCAYPTCPAYIVGTTAAQSLFTFTFEQIVNGQASRVALPVVGGRVCATNGSTSVYDCVAWGTFSCSAANCPTGTNNFHSGDINGSGCATSFGTPAAAGGLVFGKSLARSAFVCATKTNSTQFSLLFPKPVNNAGTNNNTDSDGDGLIDQLDCNSADATIQWAPIEVQGVMINGHPTSTDSWTSQASFVGSGVVYDEIRGSISQIVGFTDESCLTPATTLTSSSDPAVPPLGDGFYYLVRASGGTGCKGTYGTESNATSRDPFLTACP
jgi:hypothetical protein